jgi:hypothetical protein
MHEGESRLLKRPWQRRGKWHYFWDQRAGNSFTADVYVKRLGHVRGLGVGTDTGNQNP